MKIFFKIVAVLFVLLLLLVIAAGGFLYTFDANEHKATLIEAAETMTGRPIDIAGNIDITLYPLIGIKIDDVTIDNPAGAGFSKKAFASIRQLDIKIEIMPLLQKRLNIKTLVLDHLAIDFEKNAAGKNNWSDFINTSENNEVESKFGLSGLDIGGIEVTDASLAWLDVNTNKQFKISKMKLATEAVVKGQPLPLTFNAYIKSNEPDWQGSVFVKTMLEFKNDSPIFNAHKLKLVVKALTPSSVLEKITVAMIADGEVNVQTQTAKLSKARLSVLGLKMNGNLNIENIFSVPVIHGPLRINTFEANALASRFNITIPPMANTQSLKQVSLKTSFKTDFDSIHLDAIVAKVDESNVSGFIHVDAIQQPVISYGLNIDKINFHDYMAANSDSHQSKSPLPLDLIRSSELKGSFDVDVVTINEIELEKLHIISNIKDSVLSITPVTMLVSGSEVQATIKIDANEVPMADFTIAANNIDAESSINPLLTTIMGDKAVKLEGMVIANAELKATGENLTDLKKSAVGTVAINMDKPIIQGIDLNHTSRFNVANYANKNNFKTRKSFVTEYQPDRKTEFDKLSASFKITHGKLVNNDLLLVSEKANITGSGSIDFINSKLDYRPIIDINADNAIDIRDKLRDHPMEYHASGPFKKLSYKFEVDKYELLVGRLLLQEAKARKIKQTKGNSWQNFKSE